jgi:hypothetical protein
MAHAATVNILHSFSFGSQFGLLSAVTEVDDKWNLGMFALSQLWSPVTSMTSEQMAGHLGQRSLSMPVVRSLWTKAIPYHYVMEVVKCKLAMPDGPSEHVHRSGAGSKGRYLYSVRCTIEHED